jgi:hypothetical protein
MSSLAWLCLVVGCLLGSACDDLSDFHGDFEGAVVKGNFIRSCFPEDSVASLRFDPGRATGIIDLQDPEPNWLTTTDGTFNHTILEPVPKLEDDQLSLFNFPGPKRLQNYIVLARPSEGPLAGRDAFVVVSLLDEKRVELRVIARTADNSAACAEDTDAGPPRAGPREYFGLFRLARIP